MIASYIGRCVHCYTRIHILSFIFYFQSDIMTKLGQMDFAKERFQLDEQAKQQERQTLLAQKLKPKS